MATDYTKRNTYEAATYRLMAEYLDKDENWRPSRAIVAQVFRAMSYVALPADQIERIGAAMNEMAMVDLKEALTDMTRAKVLRSYMKRGRRLYEVNYKLEG